MTTEDDQLASKLAELSAFADNVNTTTATTTARLDKAAAARDAAHAAWRDSYELDNVVAGRWLAATVTGLMADEDDVQDTTALRVLADRVAAASSRSQRMHDPQTALVNIARAVGAIAAGTTDIVLGKIQITDAADETIDELAKVVRDLVDASNRLEQFAQERLP